MFFGYYGIDFTYIVLVLPVVVFAFVMQVRVNSVFKKHSSQRILSNLTGAQVAERVLRSCGVTGVKVERVSGNLSDHFDPKANVIRLSDSVYDSVSVAAAGVAAHECGHAVQYANGYGPIKLRNSIIPICQIGSSLSVPLILIGFLFSSQSLVNIGIVFFALAAFFQLVTLPVEFNASRRAVRALEETGTLSETETSSAKKVLNAAAMTYVAALAVSVAQLFRLILLFGGGRRRD